MSYAIEVTEKELVLLADIELDMGRVDSERLKCQGPLILLLLESLSDRKAIPEIRLRYWLDPDYQIGRIKGSHQGLFERNETTGKDIYTHVHFLPYLRYFIFGAQLPEQVIAEFQEVVGKPEWVSSGDITDITKCARRLVRKYGLHGDEEEFYRLALDMGLSQSFAQSVRDAVKQVR